MPTYCAVLINAPTPQLGPARASLAAAAADLLNHQPPPFPLTVLALQTTSQAGRTDTVELVTVPAHGFGIEDLHRCDSCFCYFAGSRPVTARRLLCDACAETQGDNPC